MTSGTYGLNTSYGTAQSDEDASYNRRDFSYSTGTADSGVAPAFLVRMRRTGMSSDSIALDDQDAGVSSSGPTLPVLFGRGSTMARSDTSGLARSGSLSVSSGVTVRSTAIAAVGDGIQFDNTSGTPATPYSAGRAKTVGRSYGGNQSAINMPGVAPFALESSFWAAVSSGMSSGTLTLVPMGSPQALSDPQRVKIQQTLTGGTAQAVGLLLSTGTDAAGHWAASSTSIGQPASLALADSTGGFSDSALLQDEAGGGVAEYVPIYTTASLGGQYRTVIGFAYLSPGQWIYTAAVPANPQTGQPRSQRR